MPQISCIDVIFVLPAWICQYDYYKKHYYGGDPLYSTHKWAGQVDKETYENEVLDRLWVELEWEEACHNAAGPWIRVKIAESVHPMLGTHVYQMQAKIATILAEFEEEGRG